MTAADDLMLEIMHLDYRDRRSLIRKKIKFGEKRARRFLYKYKSLPTFENDSNDAARIEQLRSLLLDNNLWLSSPTAFNDPFDLRCQVDVEATTQERKVAFKRMVNQNSTRLWGGRQKEVQEFMGQSPEHWKQKIEKYLRKNLDNCGVCPLSANPRSVLMWGHYGNKHTGICIQFDVARDPEVLLGAVPVSYGTEYAKYNFYKDYDMNGLGDILTNKYEDWRYEDEWRMIEVDKAKTYKRFNPSALVAIIFGWNVRPDAVEVVQKILVERSSRGIPNVKQYQTRLHPRKYALTVNRLSK